MDRRRFLGALAVGLGGLGVAACNGGEGGAPAGGATAGGAAGAAAGGRRLDRVGVQLYTLRNVMQQNVEPTLQQLSQIGYREVETFTFWDHTPEQFREMLDRHNLVSPAGHVQIDALRANADATLNAARTLGQNWAIVPFLAEGERTREGYRRVAGELNAWGQLARDRDMRIGYHNHEFEFEPLDGGGTGMDILLADTDPNLVDFELDLFWAVRGGHDPIAMFERHPGRFPLCHVKDMRGIGTQNEMVSVGEGDIDFAAIFARSDDAGLRHYFVEHDNPEDPIASVRQSYAYLQQLTF
jgi:sugar phosphate isomerase/epimerase